MTHNDLIAEFNASSALQVEFGDADIYCAYRRAELAGAVKLKSNRKVDTPPPVDTDPARAEYRKTQWEGPMKPYQHHWPGGFEEAYAQYVAGEAKRQAELVFARNAAAQNRPYEHRYRVPRS